MAAAAAAPSGKRRRRGFVPAAAAHSQRAAGQQQQQRQGAKYQMSVPYQPLGDMLLKIAAHGDGDVLIRGNLATMQFEALSHLRDQKLGVVEHLPATGIRVVFPPMAPRADTIECRIPGVQRVLKFLLLSSSGAKRTKFLIITLEEGETIKIELVDDDLSRTSSTWESNDSERCCVTNWEADRPFGRLDPSRFVHVAVAEGVPLRMLAADVQSLCSCTDEFRMRIKAGNPDDNNDRSPSDHVELATFNETSPMLSKPFSIRVRIFNSEDDKAQKTTTVRVKPSRQSTKDFRGFLKSLLTAAPAVDPTVPGRIEIYESEEEACIMCVSFALIPEITLPSVASETPEFVARFYITSLGLPE